MPKAQRVRHTLRAKSAVSSKKQPVTAPSEDVSLDTPQPTADDVLSVPEQSEAQPFAEPITLKKKEKQALKHELFIQRLEMSRSPYSRSHERRLKRRAKEQVGAGGLDDIKAALPTVDMAVPQTIQDALDASSVEPASRPQRPTQGQIGEGKPAPLSKAQRKRALATERMRIPMILQNSDFAKNPFQTIRTHAQNTLVKHEIPK